MEPKNQVTECKRNRLNLLSNILCHSDHRFMNLSMEALVRCLEKMPRLMLSSTVLVFEEKESNVRSLMKENDNIIMCTE